MYTDITFPFPVPFFFISFLSYSLISSRSVFPVRGETLARYLPYPWSRPRNLTSVSPRRGKWAFPRPLGRSLTAVPVSTLVQTVIKARDSPYCCDMENKLSQSADLGLLTLITGRIELTQQGRLTVPLQLAGRPYQR